MKNKLFGAAAAIALLVSSGANALIIDDFSVTQNVSPASAGVLETNSVTGSMIGGERTVTILNPTGTDTDVDINSPTAGEMLLSHGINTATTQLIYDGVGTGGFSALNFEAGGDDAIQFIVTQADSFTVGIEVEVFSGTGNSSTISHAGLSAPGTLNLLYSNFALATGTGADFTAVTAVQFTFTTTIGIEDAAFDLVGTANTVPDIPISEPGTLAVLGLGMIGLAGFRRRMHKRS